ncbi:Mu-like prophage protein gp29 [Citrobacter koseri]|nr:Mu-like prophage protein gp29 [Citrobacter koseri]
MSEVRDKFGLSEPEKGAALLTPSSQALQPALAINRERLALNRNQQDDIDLMVADAMQDWQRTGDAFTSPVLQLAKDADSFDAFLAGLPELQKTLEPDEFVTQLAQLCFKARALGDVNDA